MIADRADFVGEEFGLVAAFAARALVFADVEHFIHSGGLCLEHFYQACTGNSGEGLVRLKQAQLLCLQHLEQQLSELIRKHDYRFKVEERGAEMVSWKRAAGLVAGEE